MTGVPYGHLPSFLPGSASLVEQLDRKLMIILRDGRQLVGVLKTFDQFNNMIICRTYERRFLSIKLERETMSTYTNKGTNAKIEHDYYYTDIPLGLYLIRGDSVALLGEVEEYFTHGSKNDENENNYKKLTYFQKQNIKKVSPEDFISLKNDYFRPDVNEKKMDTLPWEFDTDMS